MIVKKICPNKTIGRGGKNIDYIVIHWIGIGTLESANIRFQNASSKVSAHYGISNNTVYQWVEEKDTAYHAGVWDINQRSIGIEHDATTTKNASEETYNTSGQLIREICQRHNIPIDREHIKGHKEFKATQCPGTLDLDKIISIASNGIIPHMTLEEQKVLDKVKAYKEEAGHGNLEGAIDTLIGNVNELRNSRETISNKDKDIRVLKEEKHEYEIQVQGLLAEITQYKSLESDWQRDIKTANTKLTKQIEITNEEIEERKSWQRRYNNLNEKITEKVAEGIELSLKNIKPFDLIKRGIRKLFIN